MSFRRLKPLRGKPNSHGAGKTMSGWSACNNHDGVQVEAAGEAEMERIARGIAKAASAACGYAVKIDAKRGPAWVT